MSNRADVRSAILKQRMDTRSRAFALRTSAPERFTHMKPWWELNRIAREQEEAKERAHRPIILPIRQTPTIPGLLAATLSKVTSYRPAFLGAAHA
jgi:hypothetical protein